GVISQRPKADGKKALKWNMAISSVLLFLVTLLVLSLVFSTSGVSFGDSLFEVGSALTTNGISMGATSLSLPTFYKFVLMAAMIIGKVEITIVLVSIYLCKPIVAEAARAASSRLRVFVKGIMIG
ncbi:MAG: potassium transporter TrkG, partial [Candidatus Bathyarchaeota archaeon]|nr:potassium transporter TrkG [Candidatus Bathyarchaeota archaeon]